MAGFSAWPDAQSNGTKFSNVFASFDDFGLTYRAYRAWEGAAFAQDDYRIGRSLTLNVGLRYERIGQFGDNLGRNSSFDLSKADANPPPGGSFGGYIVASNFSGTLPPGVTRVNNPIWKLWRGTKYARLHESVLPGSFARFKRVGAPGRLRYLLLPADRPSVLSKRIRRSVFRLPIDNRSVKCLATFQSPFSQPFPTPESFPLFSAYSPTTATTIYGIAPSFRPTMVQQYSLNVQTEFHEGWLMELGYVGTRGIHLVRQRSLNQALSASPSNPVRGVTTDTVANISLRVPVLGVPPDSLVVMESEGNSWYNGLEVSLTKRLSHGLQFLASYTFSKTLDTDGADINSTSSGNALTLGNQDSPSQRWGRASFDRTHRFVLSETWTSPSPQRGLGRALLGGWELAAVVTVQSGSALTIAATNPNNIFGISEDRAQLTGTVEEPIGRRRGRSESKLERYFNSSVLQIRQ